MARLALLEERLREVDLLEARLKIHIKLLSGIQANSKCECGVLGLRVCGQRYFVVVVGCGGVWWGEGCKLMCCGG